MAAVVESVGLRYLSLAGLACPVTIRLPEPLSDDELIAFSYRNRRYRIKRNADGELEISSPLNTKRGHREMFVGARLFDWPDVHGGIVVSSSSGFTMTG